MRRDCRAYPTAMLCSPMARSGICRPGARRATIATRVSESVHIIPLDARSFNARWWPDQAPTAIRVKTMPVRVLTNEKPSEPVVEPAETTASLPSPVHATKRAALRSHSDICARHRLRQVVVARGKAERLATSPRLNQRRCPKFGSHSKRLAGLYGSVFKSRASGFVLVGR